MKHLYTLALATAVAFSASAFQLDKNKTLRTDIPVKKEIRTANAQTMVKSIKKVSDAPARQNKAKAPAASSLEGIWNFQFGDYYFQTSTGPFEAEFEATVSGNYVFFEDPSNEELPFIGSYDEATGTITFERDFVASYNFYTDATSTTTTLLHVYQEPYHFDESSATGIVDDDVVGTLSADGQEITFPLDYGIAWALYTDEEGMNLYGYYSIYDLEGATKSASWEFVATGSFKENVIYGTFTGEENTVFADVDVYTNPATPGVYKVKDPYKTLYSALNFSSTSPDLIIDASNPDNVMVELQAIGISGGSDGTYYIFNESFYCEYLDPEEDLDPALICTMTKDADGNVEMIFPYHSFTVYASASQKFYYGSAAESVLRFKEGASEGSVNGIVNDNVNAPVEYYNLQGVRVANPTAGQLIIKKQGTEVTKVLVK